MSSVELSPQIVQAPNGTGDIMHNEHSVNGVNGISKMDQMKELEQQVERVSLNGVEPVASRIELDLHRACAEGRLDDVRVILSRSLDNLEVLDLATGCTPIVLAIRSNHPEIVRELLSASAMVPPPGLTNDPLLLSILYPQPMGMGMYGMPYMPSEYYPPYFEGQRYPYPPQHRKDSSIEPQTTPNGPATGNSHGVPEGTAPPNLPPAEVAKTIPCRNFPNCKYGTSCVFFHPRQQLTPAPGYYPGPPSYAPNGLGSMSGMHGYEYMPYPQPDQSQMNEHGQNIQSQHVRSPQSSEIPENQNIVHTPDYQQPSYPSIQPTQPPAFSPHINGDVNSQQPNGPIAIPANGHNPSLQNAQYGGISPTDSMLATSLPAIPPPETFFATSPPGPPPMTQQNGFVPNVVGPRRPSFNQLPFGRPFAHGKKPSFSGSPGPNGSAPRSWVPRASLPNGTPGQPLGSWKDGNPPPCAFFNQGKCRNGEFCKFPHLDAEGNDCRHPDVVRGIVPPIGAFGRPSRNSGRMNGFPNGPHDSMRGQSPYPSRSLGPHLPHGVSSHPSQPSHGAAATSEPVPTTTPETIVHPAPNSPPPTAENLAPAAHSALPTKPTPVLAGQMARSSSQPGVQRVHASGHTSRTHSPAPSNVSFGNPNPRRSRPFNHTNGHHQSNSNNATRGGNRSSSAGAGAKSQRVPGADEFPALGGPGSKGGSPQERQESRFGGKTAAQVLSAPAPYKPEVKVVPEVETGSTKEEVESNDIKGSEKTNGTGKENENEKRTKMGSVRSVSMDSITEADNDTVVISHKQYTASKGGVNWVHEKEVGTEIRKTTVSFASIASVTPVTTGHVEVAPVALKA
ncbi:hypothetical protein M231_01084 [Tremella mesenterica]|uniref:C3H1-type domain-containing protein n=1 Tax=Tremella mesenterica TaxID=5217 RepID=A0A4Q1BU57_TREME|nr:hypothetical protein M231_01084 [Tremella mesenterica]